jgi:hypothetical protein
VIPQSRGWGVISAVKAEVCWGNGAVGAVRFRDCISLADANCGGMRRIDSNFQPTLHLVRIDCGFFRGRRFLLGTSIYRIQSNAHRRVTAGANRRPVQQPSIKWYEE